jgi:hypothetical protein
MPKDPYTLYDTLKALTTAQFINVIYIEKTGTYFPGNSGPAAVKFARHCGTLDIIPYVLGVPSEYITPAKWMKTFNPPKDKAERKHHILSNVKQKFPNISIPLYAADAFALLIYAMSEEIKRRI